MIVPPTRRTVARLALVLLGLALLATGALALVAGVAPKHWPGILAWFAGAIVVHDALIAPAVFLVTLLLRRVGARLPAAVVAIVQGALVIGGIVSLVVVPEIIKRSIGTLSSSILPLDYGVNLAVFLGVLAAVTAIVAVGYARLFASRQKVRPSADQH
ncbi:hypothetical protein [Galbitalea soli]|uniref:Uncharacterized protein n=1 Tax=Galbitalea soli TaxID=1268042 RepID=A0A7C9TPQ4_9MICO|nr:hypothetical protein [Galbitalea soli]NEM90758.1 hypothetical protein [Galbitalea soli]NYJ31476.1 hypothetical protein [Galbitalea soli]